MDMPTSDPTPDIEDYWEYNDPAASEERFRIALDIAEGDYRLELLTQIARTYGLRQQFDEAHRILDDVQNQLADAGPRPQARSLLERGRTINSAGESEQARDYFLKAWEIASEAGEQGMAVDAAHMLAITYSGTPESIAWNRRGLDLARESENTKAIALIPAMLNNSAWDLHDMGRYEEALPLFEEALAVWTARGKTEQILIARWAVARCKRSLGQYMEALAQQKELEAEHLSRGSVDGYVYEEMAENLAALGRTVEAKPYFGKAFTELSKDSWLAAHEPDRLARLKANAA